MLETEDFGDIASASMPLNFFLDFYIFCVINPKIMAPCRGLNCGYFGTKSKVIGQVEEELWFFLTIFKIDGAIFLWI